MTAVELLRRLITLIYAGRSRKVMIRRELPRTEDAGWAWRLYRTEHRRILLLVCPPAVISSAFPSIVQMAAFQQPPLGGAGLWFLPATLSLHRNRPNEAE